MEINELAAFGHATATVLFGCLAALMLPASRPLEVLVT